MADVPTNENPNSSDEIQNAATAMVHDIEAERQRVFKLLEDHMQLVLDLMHVPEEPIKEQLYDLTMKAATTMTGTKAMRIEYSDPNYKQIFAEVDQQFSHLKAIFLLFLRKTEPDNVIPNQNRYYHALDAEWWWLFGNKVMTGMAQFPEHLGRELLLIPKDECQHNGSPTDWYYCRELQTRKPYFVELMDEWKQLDLQTKATELYRRTEEIIRSIKTDGHGDNSKASAESISQSCNSSDDDILI